MTVVNKTRQAALVHDYLSRHSSQLEQVDFLAVQLEHAGMWVGKPDKRQVLLVPISLKSAGVFLTNHNHLSLPFNKFLIVKAQLCHMLLAKWSGKATIKYQQYVGFPFVIGQTNDISLKILQGEIRSRCVKRNLRHIFL